MNERTVTFGDLSFPLLEARGHCGLVTWKAAHVLSAHLLAQPLEGRHVLELGAGTGMLAMALALAGARVVATDVPEGDVYSVLQANAAALSAGELTVAPLDWSASPDTWPRLEQPPDLIVGSELFYWPGQDLFDDDSLWDLPAVLEHYAGPDTEILLAAAAREEEREQRFRQLLERRFRVETVEPAEEAVAQALAAAETRQDTGQLDNVSELFMWRLRRRSL